MTECENAKKQIVDWDASDTLLNLILQGNDGFPHDADGVYQQSVLHVQNCGSCRKWLEGNVSGEFKSHLEKNNRILEMYCCSSMFSAVEYPRKEELKIKLIDFQGDPAWAVMNLESVGGNLLISYCPWCGKKMPDKQFNTEQIDNLKP